MKKYLGPLMLLSAAFIWGSSFIVMKNAVDFLTPSVLLFVRFFLASVILSIMFYKSLKQVTKENIKGGFICGTCLFIAYYVQTKGLALTTPGKNAFLTAVYCAIVPFLIWFFEKKRPDSYHFIAAFLCIIGIGFVSLDDQLSMNLGDLLTLIGGFFYALQIVFIKKFSHQCDGRAFTVIQFYASTICSFVIALCFEDLTIISQIKSDIFFQLFYLAFFATGLCMLFQTVGQQMTSECNASILLSLESVFGVLFSVLFYKEVLTLKIVIGFIIIFIAIIISQTKLSFLHKSSKIAIILCVLFSGITASHVKADTTMSVSAPYAYVLDVSTNQTLYSKNADVKIYPASMTKVMTALVALDYMKDMDTVVSVDKVDLEGLWEAGASVANFEVGEKVNYSDIIHGILLPSGADACRVAARVLFGSEEKMVKEMNKKASQLNLKQTHFMNTTGLHDNNHYTTVSDMAIITKTALKNQFFKKVFSTRYYRTQTTNRYMASSILKFHWHSRANITHIIGCKTGFTNQAKSCLTALVQSQNHDIVCVFAKEKSSGDYVEDARRVKNYCQANYKEETLFKSGTDFETINIKDGVKEKYTITVPSDIKVLVKTNENTEDYVLEYVGKKEVVAPTVKNEKIGKLNLKYKDQVLSSYDVKMNEFIEETDFAKLVRFFKAYSLYIIIGLVLILACFIRWRIRVNRKMRNHKNRKKY